jgi:hypothetical protein
MALNPTNAAWIGIVISAVLALAGFARRYSRRPHFTASYDWRPDFAGGNMINLHNQSDRAVTVTGYDVIWKSASPIRKAREDSLLNCDPALNRLSLLIPAFSSEQFSFTEQSYFSTDAHDRPLNSSIYFRLWTSVKRPPFDLRLG